MHKLLGLFKYREVLTLLGVVILAIIVALFNSDFVSPSNLLRVVNSAAILILLAAGVTPVILNRNIDVSIGSIMALAGITGGQMMNSGFSVLISMTVVIILGVVLGTINGIIVAYGGVPSIVATLGTMVAFRGISFIITGGYSIDQIPRSLTSLGTSSVLGIPTLVILSVVLVAALAVLLAKTRVGKAVYVSGDNPIGAELIGIRTRLITVFAFAISGTFAALASIAFMAQVGAITNQAGQAIEMRAIAAAVIGGVALTGGVGSVLGAAVGALFITEANSALSFMGVPGFWSDGVIGVILLLALFADARVRRQLDLARNRKKYESMNVGEEVSHAA